MAMIRNGLSLSCNPQRYMGMNSAIVVERSVWNRHGAVRNFYVGDATYSGGSPIASKSSFPVGYLHPYAWVMAPKAGGLSTWKTVTGEGDVTLANLAGGLNAIAALTGSGVVTNAALGLIVSAVAAITGSASVAADLVGKALASAGLTGSGDLAAILTAVGVLVAAVTGTGGVTAATGTAYGALAADIVVTGDLLTADSVANAVWQFIIESGYTAEQIMRLIASAQTGLTSGFTGGAATGIAFRDINDTKDRITADVDAYGNRSNIVLDPD